MYINYNCYFMEINMHTKNNSFNKNIIADEYKNV